MALWAWFENPISSSWDIVYNQSVIPVLNSMTSIRLPHPGYIMCERTRSSITSAEQKMNRFTRQQSAGFLCTCKRQKKKTKLDAGSERRDSFVWNSLSCYILLTDITGLTALFLWSLSPFSSMFLLWPPEAIRLWDDRRFMCTRQVFLSVSVLALALRKHPFRPWWRWMVNRP